MKNRGTAFLGAAAVAAALAAPVLAGPEYSFGDGGSLHWYGQLNPAYLGFSDGVEDYGALADSDTSNARIGVWLQHPYGGLELKANLESELGLRATDDLSQAHAPAALRWTRESLRKAELHVEGAGFGRLSVGQGSMAADRVTGADLSGTGLAASVSPADWAGDYVLRDASGALTGIELGDAFETYDGRRLARVRYDAPGVAGFTLSASYGEEMLDPDKDRRSHDVTLRYAGSGLGDFDLEGALGMSWTRRQGKQDRRDLIGSVSAAYRPAGLSLTLAGGERNTAGSYGYAKLGYQQHWFAAGRTSLSLDYYDGSDMVSDGDDPRAWSLAAVQEFSGRNLEAYLGYREYDYADRSTDYRGSRAVLAGARWRF